MQQQVQIKLLILIVLKLMYFFILGLKSINNNIC